MTGKLDWYSEALVAHYAKDYIRREFCMEQLLIIDSVKHFELVQEFMEEVYREDSQDNERASAEHYANLMQEARRSVSDMSDDFGCQRHW